MLGDQPGVVPGTVRVLLAARGDAPIAVCRYDDGRGHPFAFGREMFGDLRTLPGDKAVWRMLDRREHDVGRYRWPAACRSTWTPGRTTRPWSRPQDRDEGWERRAGIWSGRAEREEGA